MTMFKYLSNLFSSSLSSLSDDSISSFCCYKSIFLLSLFCIHPWICSAKSVFHFCSNSPFSTHQDIKESRKNKLFSNWDRKQASVMWAFSYTLAQKGYFFKSSNAIDLSLSLAIYKSSFPEVPTLLFLSTPLYCPWFCSSNKLGPVIIQACHFPLDMRFCSGFCQPLMISPSPLLSQFLL